MNTRTMIGWALLALVAGGVSAALFARHLGRPTVIAVVPETTAQEIWESEHAGVTHAAQPYGWKIYWNGPSREDDFPRQVQIVRQAIARKVDGLILSPDHNVVLISSVQAALDKKIPTVIVGSPLGISPGNNLTFVLNDDAATGQMAAERAAHFLKSGDIVAVLGVNPNLLSSIERAAALEEALNKSVPGVRIVERRSTSVSSSEAEETAENAIRGDPRLRAIVSLNVSQSRAAYGALLSTGQVGKIALIACDQDLDLLYHLRSGGIDSLIAQNTRAMGASAVQAMRRQLSGDRHGEKVIIPPVLVTRQNIDTEDVQQVLDMDWRVRQ